MADYDVEVELVDGHTLTVRVEDKQDSFFAAISAGEHIVKRAKAKLIAPACPLCWNSGIQRGGIRFGPGLGDPEQRVICQCPHGRELLAVHDPRKYTVDPTKGNAEPEAEVRLRTDGVHGWEGETFRTMCKPGDCGPGLASPDGEGIKHVSQCDHGRVFVWEDGWEPMPVQGEQGWRPLPWVEDPDSVDSSPPAPTR